MGGGSQQTTTRAEVPQFLEDYYRNTFFPAAQGVADTEFTPYEGQMVADVSPLSMGAQQYYQQIGDISGMTPQDYAAMNEANLSGYTQSVLDPALARMVREREVARTGEMADITRAGAFGNERRGVYEAERQAQYELGRDEMIANLMRQGYNEAQAATMAQLQTGQGAAGQAAAGMQQLGTLQQTTQQGALEAAYNEFMRQQQFPLQQLGALGAAAGVGAPLIGESSTETSRPGFAGILGAIGAAGQGLGAVGFSDRRLKKNIQQLTTENGVRYYRWEWNDEAKRIGADDTPPMGVIAQELMETHPHLVMEGSHGYLQVDYSGLQIEQGVAPV